MLFISSGKKNYGREINIFLQDFKTCSTLHNVTYKISSYNFIKYSAKMRSNHCVQVENTA